MSMRQVPDNYCLLHVGNELLTDAGHVLDIQQSSDDGTYIANNPVLCFDAAVEWARHPQSYLESNLTLVSLYVHCRSIVAYQCIL